MPLLPPLASLPLPLILLLISIHYTCSVSSQSCAPTSSCGNISITYPFSLFDPYTTESSSCGYPGLQIHCYEHDQYDIPLLPLGSNNYTISKINYDTKKISLVDSKILLQNTPNPRIDHNVSLTPNIWLNYTVLDINITFFFNCPKFSNFNVIEIMPGPAGTMPGKHTYVFPTAQIRRDYFDQLVMMCDQVVIAPVLGNVFNNQFPNLTANYGTLLREGFQLEWGNYTSESEDCVKCEKKGGQCGYNATSSSTCLCSNGSCNNSKKGHSTVTIGAIVAAIVFLLILASCISTSLFFYSRKAKKILIAMGGRNNKNLIEVTLKNFGSLAPKKYTFSEMRKITKSFNQKIGQGGYASVFKGELMDGSLVAVKVFKDHESTGEEFISEVLSIARTSHINIVKLLGFSINGSKRALIYEFMSNGSLDKYLRDSQNSTLSDVECARLFDIAIGIARGLEYLHRGCNTRIVHFDIKPHNILLDQEYCPKISDFGLAKFCQPKESIISMSGMRGTVGYIAPEVFSRNFGLVSSKSDVYSYGMMLLEMFVGKQGKMESKDFSSTETYFPDYIYKCIEQNNICSVYGISEGSAEVVQKATIVGLCCIQMMPQLRPTMSEVLGMLAKGVEELTLPPSSNVTLASVLVRDVADITASISYDQ